MSIDDIALTGFAILCLVGAYQTGRMSTVWRPLSRTEEREARRP